MPDAPDRAMLAAALCPEPARRPRLLCATRYGMLGASSRLRLGQYRPWLEASGFDVTTRPFLSDRYVRALYSHKPRLLPVAAAYAKALGARAAARRHDLLWIEKEFLPWLPYALEHAALGGVPYVLDFDDAWSLRYQGGSALVRRTLGAKFTRLLRGAALTIAANQTLFDWARAEGAGNVLLLPTVVDLAHYPPAPEPDGVFTLCWVGTPMTAAYLQLVAEPLRALSREAPLRLLIVGAPEARIDGVACSHAPWEEATEAKLIATCHAGIMPLPDDDWARGKSGYKLIQYMAAGRAAVASPVGANRTIVKDGVSGFLAEDAAAWAACLRRLRDAPALRAALGAAARQRVESRYSLQVTAPLLAQALTAVLPAA